MSRVTSAKSETRKWSAGEDFILTMLIGKASYAQIALRLGRSPGAVQLRASRKGLSAQTEWRTDAETRSEANTEALRAILEASEDDLAEYLDQAVSDEVIERGWSNLYLSRPRSS